MKILICEFMDERAVEQLRAKHDVSYQPALVDDAPQLLAAAASVDALIVRNRTQVRGDLLAALKQCRVIGRLGVGLDNIDVPGCEARSIQVIPATGANALSVAEYVVGSALLLLRGTFAASAAVSAGQWPRTALSSGREIGGKQLGLIGFGSIGQLTAKLARGLGLQVMAFDPMMDRDHPAFAEGAVRFAGLDELVRSADIISLHVPLVDGTRGLFDATRIASMKAGAVLINTARGGIVDEVALAGALKSGHLGGAAIDVFAHEPLPASAHFDGCPNLLLTPHVAGVSAESNERVSFLIAEQVARVLESPT
ncbi:MAG: hydroxyacid dehydrogenase [Rubrivivax sp.]